MFTLGVAVLSILLYADGSDCQAILLVSQSLFILPSKRRCGFIQSTYENEIVASSQVDQKLCIKKWRGRNIKYEFEKCINHC